MVTVECIQRSQLTHFWTVENLLQTSSLSLLRQLGEIFTSGRQVSEIYFPSVQFRNGDTGFHQPYYFHRRLARACDSLVNAAAMTKHFVW